MRTRTFAYPALLAGLLLLISCDGAAPANGTSAARATPGLSPVAALGEQLFRDESLSVSGRLSCQTCHRPVAFLETLDDGYN